MPVRCQRYGRAILGGKAKLSRPQEGYDVPGLARSIVEHERALWRRGVVQAGLDAMLMEGSFKDGLELGR